MKENEDFRYALPIGTTVKSPSREYRIETVLGVGGFGITYKVSTTVVIDNVPMHLYFAMKEHFLEDSCERTDNDVTCSKPAKARVEDSRKDFLSEAHRLRELSGKNPYIVPVSEVFETNNTAYYVMAYLSEGSLRDKVKDQGPMSEKEAVETILCVADAVKFLHANSINHLDIKPDNIMLQHLAPSVVKPVLIDFGLSKHFDKSGHPTSTIRVQGCSDGYAPIEQYAGLNSFAPQADIYALGATLLYMLTGKDPVIASEQTSATIAASLPAQTSAAVRNAIIGAMQMKRSERLPSAEAFIDALNDNDDPTAPTPPPLNEPNNTRRIDNLRQGGGKKSRKALWIALAVVAVLAIAGAAYFLLSAGGNKSGLADGEYEYVDLCPAADSVVSAEPDVIYEDVATEDSVAVDYYDSPDYYDSMPNA